VGMPITKAYYKTESGDIEGSKKIKGCPNLNSL